MAPTGGRRHIDPTDAADQVAIERGSAGMPSDLPSHPADREASVTTNAWAFLLWLNSCRPRDRQLSGWAALRECSAADPVWFHEQVAAFAGLGPGPQFLARHGGGREALVLLAGDGTRRSFSRDDLLADRRSALLPPMLRRRWSRAVLAQGLAETLLRQDVRADDRVMVAESAPWPALTALLEGATVILFGGAPDQLPGAAGTERARVCLSGAGPGVLPPAGYGAEPHPS